MYRCEAMPPKNEPEALFDFVFHESNVEVIRGPLARVVPSGFVKLAIW